MKRGENTYIQKEDNFEDVVWLPMSQLSSIDQMTQKLTTTGHCKAFNNEKGHKAYNKRWDKNS